MYQLPGKSLSSASGDVGNISGGGGGRIQGGRVIPERNDKKLYQTESNKTRRLWKCKKLNCEIVTGK